MLQMLLATISIVELTAYVARVLSIANTPRSYLNRYYTRALIQSLRLDADDVYNNYNTYLNKLNQIMLRCAVIRIPKDITIMQRRVWMNSNVFADDAEDVSSQVIMFKPRFVYQYHEDMGALMEHTIHLIIDNGKEVTNPDVTCTLDKIIDRLHAMINAVQMSESFGTMMGDILKAYGDSNLLKFDTITDIPGMQVVYSHEVVNQLRNGNIAE